jgi:hypothetical protein
MIVAQVPDDSILVAAYNHALNDNWERFKEYFGKERRAVYSDFLKPEHLNITNRKYFKIVKEKDLDGRCKRLFIPRKPKEVYWVGHKNFQGAKDTIDILISEQAFRCLKRNHTNFAVSCGGTMGYIPDDRLIFNWEKTSWEFVSFTNLYEAAIAKQEESLKRRTKNH